MANSEQQNILVASPRMWPVRNEITIPLLRYTYLEGLEEAGLKALRVDPGMSREKIVAKYQQSQGLLLVGGRDWNSQLYGQKPNEENDEPDDEQDAREQELLMMALNDGKPILGICRGEQGIGIALQKQYNISPETPLFIQHLAHVTDVEHSVPNYDYLHDNTHDIHIEPGTIAHEIYNRKRLTVTSGHHQALNKEALDQIPALVISGMSLDKIVEIIEMKRDEHPFCFGIQAHPEVKRDLREPLFKRFHQEAEKYARFRS
jgi:putative glutamine amidotransferase